MKNLDHEIKSGKINLNNFVLLIDTAKYLIQDYCKKKR